MREVNHFDESGEVSEKDTEKEPRITKKKRTLQENKKPRKRFVLKTINISQRQNGRLKFLATYFKMPSESEMFRQCIDFMYINRKHIKKVQEQEIESQLSKKNGETNEVR